MTTWRRLISKEMKEHGDSWENIDAAAFHDPGWMDEKFDNGFGLVEGSPFTVWTKSRVYFPCVYDGAEWCASVSRHPDSKATGHIGGQ